MIERYRARLDDGRPVPKALLGMIGNEYTIDWSAYVASELTDHVDTTVDASRVRELGETLVTVPETHKVHARVERIMQARRDMLAAEQSMDWGFAEIMAYATLLDDGFDVRITGQDSGREPSSTDMRCCMVNRMETCMCHWSTSLTVPRPSPSPIRCCRKRRCWASSTVTPPPSRALWLSGKRSFGDFANGAQVVIDQFISSGEAKWGRLCGLTLFLPHGYEGQGPEHSSARLERFLQLCAEHTCRSAFRRRRARCST